MNKQAVWALIFVAQFAFLGWMAWGKIAVFTHPAATVVWLETQPVDPFNYMSGHYMTLRPAISTAENFTTATDTTNAQTLYASLKLADGVAYPDTLYAAAADVPAGELFLKARVMKRGVSGIAGWSPGGLKFGIEEFYCDEEKRDELNTMQNTVRNTEWRQRTVRNWLNKHDMSTTEIVQFAREFDASTSEGETLMRRNVSSDDSYQLRERRDAIAEMRTTTDDYATTTMLKVRIAPDGRAALIGIKLANKEFLSRLARDMKSSEQTSE